MTPPRKRRVWTARDFAEYAFGNDSRAARIRARRVLLRLNARHEGRLLIPSSGANRRWSFYVGTLFALCPDLFAPVENLEERIDNLEDALDEAKGNERMIVDQVRTNSRAIAAFRSRDHQR